MCAPCEGVLSLGTGRSADGAPTPPIKRSGISGGSPSQGLHGDFMQAEGGPVIPLPSPPSDMCLPPYARRLDVRATRAAFAAGTLGTVGDDVAGQDGERYVVARDLDRDDADVMHAETVRQARLRRWQAIR